MRHAKLSWLCLLLLAALCAPVNAQHAAPSPTPTATPLSSAEASVRLLIARGDEERSKQNYAPALDAYAQALDTAERAGDREGMAAALFGRGLVKRTEGKYAEALSDFGRSLSLYEALGNRARTAVVLNGIGVAYHRQEEYELALEHYRRSLSLLEALADQAGVANAQKNIGLVSRLQGNYARALEFNLKSLALSEQLGDRAKVADMLNNIGIIHDLQGDYAEALASYRKSLDLYEALGNPANTLLVLHNIGLVYEHQGNYAPALAAYRKVFESHEAQGDKPNTAIALNNIGNVHSLQGNFAQALDHFQRALALSEQTGKKVSAATILNNIGEIYRLQGNYTQALVYIERSLGIHESLGTKDGIAAALTNMGDVRRLQGDHAQATAHYLRGLALREELGDKKGISQLLNDLALVSQMRGDHTRALEQAGRAAAVAQQIGSNETLWEALSIEGVSYRALGQPEAAVRSFRASIAAVEAMRSGVAGGEQEQQRFFEGKLSPYHVLIELLLDRGDVAGALDYAENAKARSLLDVIRRGRLNITRSMSETERARERELRNALISLGTQIRNESARSKPDAPRLDDLRAQLQKARLDYEAFQVGVYAAHPQVRRLRGEALPAHLGEADTRNMLDADNALLEFVVMEQKTYLFVLTRADRAAPLELKHYALNVGRKELTERVEQSRRQIAGRDVNFRPRLRELYNLLLAPAAKQLRDKRTLVIAPDDVLWRLPFQALQPDDASYLLERHSIFYVPSLTVLSEMMKPGEKTLGRTRPPATLLAFGNPAFGDEARAPRTTGPVRRDETFVPLPEAEREVKTLAQLYGSGRSRVYVGAQAAEERFKAEAGSYGVLHLATHGVVNDSNPMYSYVVLARGSKGKEDGLVEAWELMEMDLKTELVVLSACETGGGRVGAGEGMIGLSWALFMAGSPAAVVSQWKVESQGTTELMLEFHRNLLAVDAKRKGSTSKSEALRQAALKLMRNAQYRHPFYWAGFIAVGDAR